jgi:hypothetical protein
MVIAMSQPPTTNTVPEMLQVLEELVDAWNNGDCNTDAMFDTMARARRVIVKARGRGIGALLTYASAGKG